MQIYEHLNKKFFSQKAICHNYNHNIGDFDLSCYITVTPDCREQAPQELCFATVIQ
jgi:hypothetical protein